MAAADADPVAPLMIRLDTAAPYDLAEETGRFLHEVLDVGATALWLVDYSGTSLGHFQTMGGLDDVEEMMIVGADGVTLAGEAFVHQRVTTEPFGDGWRTWVPVTTRCDRLGVLELLLPAPADAERRRLLVRVGEMLAVAVIAAQAYTDVYYRTRRRRELSLAAEIQWQLLPVLACTGPDFSVAGALEPAYDIGGDSFDYSIDRDRLNVVLLDGMGHGLPAAMLTALALAAVRNGRRWGYPLVEQARLAGEALHEQYAGDQFVTAVLIEIDRRDGTARAVNAGHPVPVRVRDGVAESVTMAADLPLGLWPDRPYVAHRFALERGDRLLLISDGVIEATPSGGAPFGPDRLADLLTGELADHAPPAVVRAVTGAVVAHRGDVLRDDTTSVCLDWSGLD